MRLHRSLLLVVLLAFLSLPSCWADVRLTDDEYQRISQILKTLEIINSEQMQTLTEQRQQLDSSQETINNLQTTIDDLQKDVNNQQTLFEKEKKSLKKRGSVVSLIATIVSYALGFVIGALFI